MEEFNYMTEAVQWSEVELKGVKNYFVEGYISTIDKDDYNEVVTIKAQEKILKSCQERIKSGTPITMDIEHEEFYDENGKVMQKPKNSRISVGKIVHAELRSKGVWVKTEINKDSERFSNIWSSIKNRFLHSFSIAFAPLRTVTKSINGEVHKFIEDLNLINVTLTGSPVNTNATFVPVMKAAIKAMENKMVEENNEAASAAPVEAPVEAPKEEAVQEAVSEEERPVTVNDLVDTVKELEKQKAELADQKSAFEKQKAEWEAKQAEPAAEPETQAPEEEVIVNPLSQIKAHKDKIKQLESENAKLKARLATPILKSKIRSKTDVEQEIPMSKKLSPLDSI